MPRPPILPTIDWQRIFDQGRSYADWLAIAEHPEHVAEMEKSRGGLSLASHEVAWLNALPRTVHVVAIAEDWCGDVVRHAPVLARLAEATPHVRLRFIARADAPDVFARFLTNGGEAIPKFIFLSDRFVECGNWGPMPDECREWIARGKACGDVAAARRRVGALYQADADRRVVIRELLHLIDVAATPAIQSA